ncbi:MAG TPA: cell surface protein SprA, partial [Gemmatimonadaceae bacterium]
MLIAQTPPRDTTKQSDSTRKVVMPRPPADSDSTKRPNVLTGVPGIDQLPFQLNIRTEAKSERYANLRCSSGDQAQLSVISGCSPSFLFPPPIDAKWSLKATGKVGDRFNVNIDYDAQREFDASNVFSVQYEGKQGSKLERFDVGNITFAPPPSRFITSSLPSGNFGAQMINQFGRLKVKSIFAQQTGNVVQTRRYTLAARAEQHANREIEDYQIERLRFFFTLDPALFGSTYPNIDILNRRQMQTIWNALPDTLRPTRVMLYRWQFGAQPQNANGPRFRIQGDPAKGTQTYDVLREGVDYYLDPSKLWFALVRPLNETNERLLVAYNVRINGRDTVWVTTGGTPDVQATTAHDQVANLVMDPTVAPSSSAFTREIRSVYRIAGEELVRRSTRIRIVTGGGLLEHPLAGSDATFLQMFGLSQPTNPSQFDFENRIWPRESDPIFDLGAGAVDIRNGQRADMSRIIRDYFLVFPSVRPFAERGGGMVVSGNPVNDAIYRIPGEYLYSPQHPASVYRIALQYETVGTDDFGSLTLGAAQMRPGSDRVVLDGRPLVRDLDYTIDYDLGRIQLLRADTLLRQERDVDVRYEENPIFQATPTTLAGVVSELPFRNGVLNFTAINQSQSTLANRPQLGFQDGSNFTTGVSGQFSWAAPALTRLVNRLPFGQTQSESRITIGGEIATSRPQFFARNQGQAWLEVFEGGGGIGIPLGDIAWHYSSLPAYGRSLRSPVYGLPPFEENRASTMVWQSNGRTPSGGIVQFTQRQIDPLTTLYGSGFEPNEPVLWLTLLPLAQVGRYRPDARRYDWKWENAPSGRRFRSINATLSPAGLDLTRGEFLEFWALVDTSSARRSSNPTLIFDFGDISENTLTFAPETLTVSRNGNGVDSVFNGRRKQGFDRLDSERDPYSHAFNFEVNDKGLPGDVADTLVVRDGSSIRREFKVPICRYALGTTEYLGNPRANCTVDNSRLDEEDIDLDNALNLTSANRENERLLRYIIDLSDPKRYRRVGGSYTDTTFVNNIPTVRTRQWVLVSAPFGAPTDSLNEVNRRRIRSVRLTMVSGAGQSDAEETQLPLARISVTGAPWISRAPTSLSGVGGISPGRGFVVTSAIGTNDSSATLVYQPPPGVGDVPDFKGSAIGQVKTAINEHSMRIQAGWDLPLYHRAEAYIRFSSGPQDHLAYKRLRVWGRGRGNGWGTNGELQMFVKLGRDENNFYLYRVPMEAGATQAAWTDLSVDFARFKELRRRVQADYLAGKTESVACTGVDSAIVAASPTPVGTVVHRFAACEDGYMVYTLDPAVTAPNLASVQELAAGFVRVGTNGGASTILPSDTLELWIDDMRLVDPDNSVGVAGQFTFGMNAADLGDLRVTFANKNPYFRQIGEQPTFLGARNVDVIGTLHLEKMLPRSWGLALPLTINKSSLANDPLYLSRTDIPGQGVSGLRKPKTDLTTYSLSVRRATPTEGGPLAPLINNLGLTSTYVSGIDRTEYQDGKSRNLNLSLDYVVTQDSARVVALPGLTAAALRWNPTQFRVTTGIERASDRRESFIKPANAVDDQASVSNALTRLWRSGSVLELQPATGLMARWQLESVRDLRDYGDNSVLGSVASRDGRQLLGANAGFERERSLLTNLSWRPEVSSWLRPRAELGTQYGMLRDPNTRSLVPLPGVIGVDSVIAARDSLAMSSSFTLP